MLLILSYRDVKKALPGNAVNQNGRQQETGKKWEDRDRVS